MGLKQWSAALSLAVTLLLVLVLVGNGPIAKWLARSLQDPAFFTKPHDFGRHAAIVLLGDGTIVEPPAGERRPRWLAYSRIETAAEAYHMAKARGASCDIVVSGDDSVGPDPTGPSVYVTRLSALGVSDADVKLEPKGRNTYHQAELATRILEGGSYERIVIVTSGLHMKRALQYFRHFGIDAIPVPSDYVTVEITVLPSGQNLAIADIALHQFAGMVRLRLYNKLGLNK